MTEIGMRRRVWTLALGVLMILVSSQAWAQQAVLPAGMSFVAQDAAQTWRLYRVDARGSVHVVPTQLEPRQACVSQQAGTAVYAAADGTLRIVSLADAAESVLAKADAQRTFVQPCLSADGRDVYAVEMIEGKSLETDVVRFGANAQPVRLAHQPGAQQEPFIHAGRWLVYTSIGCSDGCGEMLVEVWSRDLLAGQTRQLTLLNAIVQGPVTDGRRVVFSGNASGSFQLWQVELSGAGMKQMTTVEGQAVQPALCNGSLYFINMVPGAAHIAVLSNDGGVTKIAIPGVKAFRALRCVS